MSVGQLSEREPLLAREDVRANLAAHEPLDREPIATEDTARVIDNDLVHGKRKLGMIAHPFILRTPTHLYPVTRRLEHDIPYLQPADRHWVRPFVHVLCIC